MFAVIYRWRVRPGLEERFRNAWHNRTQKIYAVRGSYGSSLYREDDGTFCAVALWPSRDAWEDTQPALPDDDADAAAFRESIAELLPAQTMTLVDDLWKMRPMLDHLSLGVSDFARSVAFYDAVLAPMNYRRLWTAGNAAGYGTTGADEPFAIKEQAGEIPVPADRCHFAFGAPSKDAVRQFHSSALALGAIDEGGAGYHDEYGEGYFAAFVRDLDGYRIEAVFHGSRGSRAAGSSCS